MLRSSKYPSIPSNPILSDPWGNATVDDVIGAVTTIPIHSAAMTPLSTDFMSSLFHDTIINDDDDANTSDDNSVNDDVNEPGFRLPSQGRKTKSIKSDVDQHMKNQKPDEHPEKEEKEDTGNPIVISDDEEAEDEQKLENIDYALIDDRTVEHHAAFGQQPTLEVTSVLMGTQEFKASEQGKSEKRDKIIVKFHEKYIQIERLSRTDLSYDFPIRAVVIPTNAATLYVNTTFAPFFLAIHIDVCCDVGASKQAEFETLKRILKNCGMLVFRLAARTIAWVMWGKLHGYSSF